MYLGSTSEQTPSESAVTSEAVSEGEVVAGVSRHKMRQTSKQAYDYAEPVESASSISTPPAAEDPFASDNLGDTVIKFGDVSTSEIFCYIYGFTAVFEMYLFPSHFNR